MIYKCMRKVWIIHFYAPFPSNFLAPNFDLFRTPSQPGSTHRQRSEELCHDCYFPPPSLPSRPFPLGNGSSSACQDWPLLLRFPKSKESLVIMPAIAGQLEVTFLRVSSSPSIVQKSDGILFGVVLPSTMMMMVMMVMMIVTLFCGPSRFGLIFLEIFQ